MKNTVMKERLTAIIYTVATGISIGGAFWAGQSDERESIMTVFTVLASCFAMFAVSHVKEARKLNK